MRSVGATEAHGRPPKAGPRLKASDPRFDVAVAEAESQEFRAEEEAEHEAEMMQDLEEWEAPHRPSANPSVRMHPTSNTVIQASSANATQSANLSHVPEENEEDVIARTTNPTPPTPPTPYKAGHADKGAAIAVAAADDDTTEPQTAAGLPTDGVDEAEARLVSTTVTNLFPSPDHAAPETTTDPGLSVQLTSLQALPVESTHASAPPGSKSRANAPAPAPAWAHCTAGPGQGPGPDHCSSLGPGRDPGAGPGIRCSRDRCCSSVGKKPEIHCLVCPLGRSHSRFDKSAFRSCSKKTLSREFHFFFAKT